MRLIAFASLALAFYHTIGSVDQTLGFLRAGGQPSSEPVHRLRAESLKVFKREQYAPDEEAHKRANTLERRRQPVDEFVRAFSADEPSFAVRENELTVWDDEQIKRLASVEVPALNGLHEKEEKHRAYSSSKDWRESGCVAEPRDQIDCAACYAISVLGVIETMRCLRADRDASLPRLSVQQIVDCSTPFRNNGCAGGWPTRVLDYLQDANAIATEQCYPFTRAQGQCRSAEANALGDNCTIVWSPHTTRLKFQILYSEDEILQHVAQVGPVVTVMRQTASFNEYAHGVFEDAQCSRLYGDVSHAVQIVGYGTDARTGLDYWLIKNSWGTRWGQRGYGKVRRGVNACSIGHWGWAIAS